MNNVCPTEERLVEFALSPLQEENIDIVMHISRCEECSRKLDLMNHVFLSECEISPEELAEIRRFSRHAGAPAKTAGSLWEKVERLLLPVFTGKFVLSGDLRELPLAAASQGTRGDGKVKEDPAVRFVDLTFEANCDDGRNEYWKASLRIGLSAENETRLPVSVTDGKGRPVAEGTLVLCGKKLPVTNGRASISLGDFRSSLRNREVAFLFVSGKRMDGSLVFALEDLK